MASSGGGGGGGGGDGFPCASRYLNRLQTEKFYQLHRAKLAEQTTTLDTSPPKEFPHLYYNLNKLQKEQEQMAQVEYENAVMLAHVEGIMAGAGRVDNWNFYISKSLNREARVKEQVRITKENQVLGRRLETSRPRYASCDLKKHTKQHKYLMSLLDRSTKEWTMRGKPKPALWKPSRYQKSRQSNVHYSYLPTSPPPDPFKLPHLEDAAPRRPPYLGAAAKADHKQLESELKDELAALADMPRADRDALALFNLCKGKGDIEQILVNTLVRRSRADRVKIQARFRESYDMELIPELKSELGEEYDLVVDLLLRSRYNWEATAIHRLLTEEDPEGRRGSVLTEMMLSKLKMEIREIADVYGETYGSSLSEALLVNTAGDLQRFLAALLSRSLTTELPPVDGIRGSGGAAAVVAEASASATTTTAEEEEAAADIASNTPEEDAKRLAGIPAETWIGGIAEGPLIKMLRDRHLAHIRSAIDAFNADETLELSLLEALERHQSPDFVESFKTFLAWLQNPYAFYADKMHAAIVERDAETLTTLLIMRAEDGHMPMVRKMYKKRWTNDVVDDLKDAFKGNIGKVMTTAAKMTKMLTPTMPPKQQSQRSLLSGLGSGFGSSLDPGDHGSGAGSVAAAGAIAQSTPSPVEDRIVEVPTTPFVDEVEEEEEEEEKGGDGEAKAEGPREGEDAAEVEKAGAESGKEEEEAQTKTEADVVASTDAEDAAEAADVDDAAADAAGAAADAAGAAAAEDAPAAAAENEAASSNENGLNDEAAASAAPSDAPSAASVAPSAPSVPASAASDAPSAASVPVSAAASVKSEKSKSSSDEKIETGSLKSEKSKKSEN